MSKNPVGRAISNPLNLLNTTFLGLPGAVAEALHPVDLPNSAPPTMDPLQTQTAQSQASMEQTKARGRSANLFAGAGSFGANNPANAPIYSASKTLLGN